MKKIVAGIMIMIVMLFTIIIYTPNVFASSDTLSNSDKLVSSNNQGKLVNTSSSTKKENDSLLIENNKLEETTNSELVSMKTKAENEIQRYEELYGSKTYGYTAYVLNKIRIFSIPLCFLGIAVGSIYQYVIGIRKLDVRDRGFLLSIGFVTVLVICQILPLVFAIIVQGWRG